MTDASLSLEHHLAELRQVAAELRAARQARPAQGTGLTASIRTVVGRAFLAAATALLAEPGSTRLVPR
ncbi:MAG TPA: hypothetical protein VGJ17_02495 [Candidatus Limnocylindrales bacterium]